MTLSHWAMPYGVRLKVLLVRLGLIGLFLVLALVGKVGLILFELMAYTEEEEAAWVQGSSSST